MMAIFLGICVAVLMIGGWYLAPTIAVQVMLPSMVFEAFFCISLFFSSLPWVWSLFLTMGSETTPTSSAALRSNIQDRTMYLYSASIILAALLGIIVLSYPSIPTVWPFAISAILIGVILDGLRLAYFRLHYRRSPEGIADWIIEIMKFAVKRGDERLHTMSFEIIFTLITAYIKNEEFDSMRLFCRKIITASDVWLGSMARVSLFKIPGESEETLLDRYSLAEAMTTKRLSWIIKESCEAGSSPAFEEAVHLTGKMFLIFHSYHPSLGFLLLMTLSQISQKLDEKISQWDRDVELMATFSEVVKSLIDASIDRGISDTGSIVKVLEILETHVKECFRREKTVNAAFLMQPFAEIAQMLTNPRYAAFDNRDDILSRLKRALAQFAAIETVTNRLEIAGEGTDTKASFREDLPFMAQKKDE